MPLTPYELPSSAEQEAYRHLLKAIRAGRYEPGRRLIAEEIAAELGTSRMPVREALRRLSSEGLVVMRPNRGCNVTELTRDGVFELFEIRSVLEGLAIRLAMPSIDRSVLADLELLLDQMKGAEDVDEERWLSLHTRFHDRFCALSNRPELARRIRTLHVALEPYLRIYRHHARKSRTADAAHRQLFDVIARGDAAAAETAMREHVLGTAPLIVPLLTQRKASPAPQRRERQPQHGHDRRGS